MTENTTDAGDVRDTAAIERMRRWYRGDVMLTEIYPSADAFGAAESLLKLDIDTVVRAAIAQSPTYAELQSQLAALSANRDAMVDAGTAIDEAYLREMFGDPTLDTGGTYFWHIGTFDQSWYADDKVTSVRVTQFGDDLFAVEMLTHDRDAEPSFWARPTVHRIKTRRQLQHLIAALSEPAGVEGI